MTKTGYFVTAWSIAAIALLAALLLKYWPAITVMFDSRATARNFYVASTSMAPTLQVGDVVRPLRSKRSGYSPGMIVIFKLGQDVRIDRIIGRPGDTVMVAKGRVAINRRTADISNGGHGPTIEGTPTLLYQERLPGEAQSHEVLDSGSSAMDDFAPMRVPNGRLFLLGDNRDMSADSRLPIDQGGIGLVPIASVVGYIDTVLWDAHGGNVGRHIR